MAATVTYNLANELMGQGLAAQGHDGYIAWQSVYLINDGRICSFGTGNHVENQSNAMRIIDPVAAPPAVSIYNAYPWTQTVIPPTIDPVTPFRNHYVTNYDNHPSIYIPSENKAVWLGHGVYDFAAGVNIWTHGNQPFPVVPAYTAFIADPVGMANIYNPAVGWSHELNMGIFFGASGGGGDAQNNYRLVKRNPVGSPTPWSIVAGQLTTVTPVSYARNSAVVIGEYFYLDGGNTREFSKIHLPTMTKAATLAVCPLTNGGQAVPGTDYFPQMVYDQRRRKIIMIGSKLWEYDVPTDVWTDITPVGWPGFQTVRGVYHPRLDAIFFSGWNASLASTTDSGHFSWHKITFSGTGGSNWRQIDINPSFNAYDTGAKHVNLTWHPVKRRVYSWGGDWSTGPSLFGQPNDEQTFVTNEPSNPQSYVMSSSLRNDQYSFDPYIANPVSWRLEHPYLPRNLSGTREERPARPDQTWQLWDPIRSKFWMLQNVLRTEFSFYPHPISGLFDVWANGSLTQSPQEPDATWSWTPGANGSPGTFIKESTTNRLLYRVGSTFYSGNNLISGIGDERIGGWARYPDQDCYACLSAAPGSTKAIFFFKPATLTYEYRTLTTSGYNRVDCSTSYGCIVGDWIYAVAIATTTGSVRQSVLIRVNVRDALGVANQGNLAASAFQAYVLPWSLSPGNVWESVGDASSKWQEHAGLCNVNGKVMVIKSYDTILEDGVTKLAIFNPDTGLFTAAATAPSDFGASSWVYLPETAEVLMGLTTVGTNHSILFAYSDRLVSGAGDSTPPTVSITSPSNGAVVSGSTVGVIASASDNVGVVGVQFTLDGVNLQSEDPTSPYSIIWDTTLVSNGSHILRAIARDAAGNSTTSSPITVTVSNITIPLAPTNLRRV